MKRDALGVISIGKKKWLKAYQAMNQNHQKVREIFPGPQKRKPVMG